MTHPESIAIIGASADRTKYGNKAVRAYKQQGFTVYPVNPKATEIEGLKAYPSVADLPEIPAQASFYVPPAVGMSIIREVAAKGISTVWLNPGSESDDLINTATSLGIQTIVACSIVAVDVDPDQL